MDRFANSDRGNNHETRCRQSSDKLKLRGSACIPVIIRHYMLSNKYFIAGTSCLRPTMHIPVGKHQASLSSCNKCKRLSFGRTHVASKPLQLSRTHVAAAPVNFCCRASNEAQQGLCAPSTSSSSSKARTAESRYRIIPTLSILSLASLVAAAPALAWEIQQEPANALSLPTWAIHVSSVIEWIVGMGLFWKYAEVSGRCHHCQFICSGRLEETGHFFAPSSLISIAGPERAENMNALYPYLPFS